MFTVQDIPLREDLSGQEQLDRLRANLFDTDQASYLYPTQFLINKLVESPRSVVASCLVGREGVAFSYDENGLYEPLNRLRLAIADTDELTMRYTDWQLLGWMTVYPLRYLVLLIKYKEGTLTQVSDDPYDPINIVNQFLATDATLVDLATEMLASGKDPYGYVMDQLRTMAVESGAEGSTSGGQLASIDGISFSQVDTQGFSSTEEVVAHLAGLRASSPYAKNGLSIYEFYQDGVSYPDPSEIASAGDWYALQ